MQQELLNLCKEKCAASGTQIPEDTRTCSPIPETTNKMVFKFWIRN